MTTWNQAALTLCPDGQIHNDTNAERAAKALLAVYPSYDNDTLQTAINDVLCDLRHLCDLAGLSFWEIDDKAHASYRREVHECDGTAKNADLERAIKEDLT